MTKLHRTTVTTLAAVLLALGLTACGENEPETFDASGGIILSADDFGEWTKGTLCHGSGGYDDIDEGASVTIYDNKDVKIATGSLGEGVAITPMACMFEFTVKDVPVQETDIYGVEVTHRGQVTFKRADADDIGLTLG